MDTELGMIAGKTNDYKKCKECGSFNWYENKACHNCHSAKFKKVTQKDIKEEVSFWMTYEGGCTEDEAYSASISI